MLGKRKSFCERTRTTLDKSPLVINGARFPATKVEQFGNPKSWQVTGNPNWEDNTALIWFSNQGIAGIEPAELRPGSSCCNCPKAGRRNWPEAVSLKFVVVAASPTASSLRPIRFT